MKFSTCQLGPYSLTIDARHLAASACGGLVHRLTTLRQRLRTLLVQPLDPGSDRRRGHVEHAPLARATSLGWTSVPRLLFSPSRTTVETMTDRECVEFLQWALPRMGLCWPGFRKVRRQVHKRIVRRLGELGLQQILDYRRYLEAHSAEWTVLDAFSRISISRFYRDRDVFDHLRDATLPELAHVARDRNETRLCAWSAGCASGEEPYSLAILWNKCVQPDFPEIGLHVVATDVDEHMLERARRAVYAASSVKDVPADWIETAFVRAGDAYQLGAELCGQVEFRQQDIRDDVPGESFHLVLCRNLVFTYFAEPLQRQVLERIADHLVPGGFLLIGKHEALRGETQRLSPSPSGITATTGRSGRTISSSNRWAISRKAARTRSFTAPSAAPCWAIA